jgi:hypothetical protein
MLAYRTWSSSLYLTDPKIRPVGRSASEESTEEAASAQLAYIAEFGSCEKCCRCAFLAVELLLAFGVKGASTSLSRGSLRVVLRLDLLFHDRLLEVAAEWD